MSGHGTALWRAVISGAQPRDRLTDDRQLLCNGVAKRLIAQKICLQPSVDCLRNPVQRFQNVVQALLITPHRSTVPRLARRAG